MLNILYILPYLLRILITHQSEQEFDFIHEEIETGQFEEPNLNTLIKYRLGIPILDEKIPLDSPEIEQIEEQHGDKPSISLNYLLSVPEINIPIPLRRLKYGTIKIPSGKSTQNIEEETESVSLEPLMSEDKAGQSEFNLPLSYEPEAPSLDKGIRRDLTHLQESDKFNGAKLGHVSEMSQNRKALDHNLGVSEANKGLNYGFEMPKVNKTLPFIRYLLHLDEFNKATTLQTHTTHDRAKELEFITVRSHQYKVGSSDKSIKAKPQSCVKNEAPKLVKSVELNGKKVDSLIKTPKLLLLQNISVVESDKSKLFALKTCDTPLPKIPKTTKTSKLGENVRIEDKLPNNAIVNVPKIVRTDTNASKNVSTSNNYRKLDNVKPNISELIKTDEKLSNHSKLEGVVINKADNFIKKSAETNKNDLVLNKLKTKEITSIEITEKKVDNIVAVADNKLLTNSLLKSTKINSDKASNNVTLRVNGITRGDGRASGNSKESNDKIQNKLVLDKLVRTDEKQSIVSILQLDINNRAENSTVANISNNSLNNLTLNRAPISEIDDKKIKNLTLNMNDSLLRAGELTKTDNKISLQPTANITSGRKTSDVTVTTEDKMSNNSVAKTPEKSKSDNSKINIAAMDNSTIIRGYNGTSRTVEKPQKNSILQQSKSKAMQSNNKIPNKLLQKMPQATKVVTKKK